jgi:type II secretory pathway predicted ATPase ExeA
MYEQFYGLGARPFDLTPDPRYLVLTDVHREALSNLEYACQLERVTLASARLAGKTTIIRAGRETGGADTLRAPSQPGVEPG